MNERKFGSNVAFYVSQLRGFIINTRVRNHDYQSMTANKFENG